MDTVNAKLQDLDMEHKVGWTIYVLFLTSRKK